MLSTSPSGNRVTIALRMQHWALVMKPFSLGARFRLKV